MNPASSETRGNLFWLIYTVALLVLVSVVPLVTAQTRPIGSLYPGIASLVIAMISTYVAMWLLHALDSGCKPLVLMYLAHSIAFGIAAVNIAMAYSVGTPLLVAAMMSGFLVCPFFISMAP